MTAFNHSEEQYQEQSQAKDMNTERKSLFGSKTFWGILFTSMAAIAPIVGKDIDKTLKQKEPVNYGEDAAQVVVIVCGAAASIVGRVEAKSPIYTPKWMPGPNDTDLSSSEGNR